MWQKTEYCLVLYFGYFINHVLIIKRLNTETRPSTYFSSSLLFLFEAIQNALFLVGVGNFSVFIVWLGVSSFFMILSCWMRFKLSDTIIPEFLCTAIPYCSLKRILHFLLSSWFADVSKQFLHRIWQMKIWRKVPCCLELCSLVCESLTHHNEEARMIITFLCILQTVSKISSCSNSILFLKIHVTMTRRNLYSVVRNTVFYLFPLA
jgi:hypothetical protein